MNPHQCSRCGDPLPAGATKYTVEISIRSMYDGIIPDLSEPLSEDDSASIVSEMDNLSEDELTRQIYEDISLVMCPTCKEAFVREIRTRGRPTVPPRGRKLVLIK